ncbi:WcaF family extracellular polysaccharide biosynthesis acetyltransferase [Tropicimonas isoalkanivorans]|uniref:Putative colanic acid biosynthesis acetyltransferase WcaF n=1 Tax=Tropicimonas isoalkanivorans TaxID=441112 RepID=A0A1I1DTQ8_9RHOB|nr:WcaF family extracellular polysaccharide biosynthesis acetyltransferase [Tropicimonas isoalkanivorans]SFB77796.1 putative colanic acid biosynthesis acetyltransferase WcaF [Tropicimonas isoalkanivorans]
MRLDRFSNPEFDRGASRAKEAAWTVVSGVLVASWIPGTGWRRTILRAFGAEIGDGVVIKPGLRVKFPWRLKVGDHVWLGEDVWIDNLAQVTIGGHSCLSQGAYLCTGSHDWADPRFSLQTRPIVLEGECWVGARACLAPGTVMERGAVLTMAAVGTGRLSGWTIHGGYDGAVHRPRMERRPALNTAATAADTAGLTA